MLNASMLVDSESTSRYLFKEGISRYSLNLSARSYYLVEGDKIPMITVEPAAVSSSLEEGITSPL